MTHRLCIVDDCNKRPTFGIYNTDTYCKEHSLGDIVDYSKINNTEDRTTIKLCGVYRCKNKAEYNFNDCIAIVCEKHMITDFNLYKENKLRAHKTPRDCTYNNCNSSLDEKKAIISYKKKAKHYITKEDKECTGLFCKDCSVIIKKSYTTMIKVGTTSAELICLEKSCKNVRQFGTTSSKTPAICEDCYENSDKQIYSTGNKHKFCKFENCNVRASYNYDGEPAKFCVEHKEENMINTDAKKCEIDGCNTQPVFGFEEEFATRCKTHALENMIDVRSNRCDIEECYTHACYRNDNNVRCGKHKEANMAFMYKSLQCREPDCIKFSSFGFAEERPTKCFEHREEFMLNVVSSVCSMIECNILASYGYEIKRTRERCSTHRLDNMVDLTLVMCSECKVVNMNKKYKPYCYQCFAKLNPEHEKVIEYKTKENAFTLKLKEKYKDSILDKKITGGVSNHRPDFLLNFDTYAIIVEIDENQHYRKDLYNKEAEDHRLECFKLSLYKPIIVIRLNPDNYRISEELVRGCFAYDENKKLAVRPEEYKIRLNRLFEEVDKWAKQLSVLEFQELDEITEVFLFYNQ